MSATNDELLRRRIVDLEAENARLATENASLREFNEMLRAQRREALDILCPVDQIPETTEEELIDAMKNHVPGSGMKFLEELGIFPKKAS
jgi:hypothetical protein